MIIGILAALTASLIWGIAPAIIRLGVREESSSTSSAIVFNTIRVIVAIPTTLAIMLALREPLVHPVSLIGWIAVFAAGTIGPGIGDVAYIYAIREIGGGRAVTIGYTYILVSQFLAVLLLGEEYTLNLMAGSLLAITGIWLVATEAKEKAYSVKGVVASCISATAWGFGSIANKWALEYTTPLSLAVLRMTLLLPILLALSWKSFRSLNRKLVYSSIFTGATSYGIAMPLFLYALNIVGVSVTVLVTALSPVLGRITSRILASEEVTIKGIAGTLITIVGLVIGTMGMG